MIWRTGTKNPHALYCDIGEVSIPHGFIMQPAVAERICDALNGKAAARLAEQHALLDKVRELLSATKWEPTCGMARWTEETVDGRSFKLVSEAIELLNAKLGREA